MPCSVYIPGMADLEGKWKRNGSGGEGNLERELGGVEGRELWSESNVCENNEKIIFTFKNI